MEKKVICTAAVVGLFVAAALVSNRPVQGQNNGDHDDDREEFQSRVRRGFAIAPVDLNLQGKRRALVGLGSYIVNAQGGCNDCHTCPSYTPGHNPFPPPAGVSGDGQINSVNYLAGGVDFVIAKSANLTPDSAGKPAGLTLEQFVTTIRTGHDPVTNQNLTIMPWPVYRNMTDRDLDAIYAYLSAIPPAVPGNCVAPGQ